MRVREPSWQLHEIEGKAKVMVDANDQKQQGSVCRPQAHWFPPPAGTYKANFDAAMSEELNCAGLGVVYRDHSS